MPSLPLLTDENRHFWTGGADGELLILRCTACGHWLHPPGPRCPQCGSHDLVPRATSGFGTIHTFTVNHQQWTPDEPVPSVVAVVDLAEQDGLRVLTNIIGPLERVRIGAPVHVVFEQHDDVHLPKFELTEG